MQVILLEKVRNLGDLGDTVNVRSGFGRNYLIPQGKAVFASKDNAEVFEQRRSELEKAAAEKLKLANSRAGKLQSLKLVIDALSSDDGKLYGSVGVNEIAKAINEAGVEVAKKEIVMPLGSIHEVGEHSFDVILHSDVAVALTVSVGSPSMRSNEEEMVEEVEEESDYSDYLEE
jgi:large subunit ribosomal protein L9